MSPSMTVTGVSPASARARALWRVHSMAPWSRSTAVTCAAGHSCAIDSAIAPEPEPRSTTTGAATPASRSSAQPGAEPRAADGGSRAPGEPFQRPAGELFGLRTGHEHARADGELQEPE